MWLYFGLLPTRAKKSNLLDKGGVGGTGAVKILALPKRGGGGGSDPCQDFLVDL